MNSSISTKCVSTNLRLKPVMIGKLCSLVSNIINKVEQQGMEMGAAQLFGFHMMPYI